MTDKKRRSLFKSSVKTNTEACSALIIRISDCKQGALALRSVCLQEKLLLCLGDLTLTPLQPAEEPDGSAAAEEG